MSPNLTTEILPCTWSVVVEPRNEQKELACEVLNKMSDSLSAEHLAKTSFNHVQTECYFFQAQKVVPDVCLSPQDYPEILAANSENSPSIEKLPGVLAYH